MKRIWLSILTTEITLFLCTIAWAQTKTRINWTAVTGAQSGMFMAQQEGLFKKNGLDVELIHIPSSSRGIQAILAGEIGFSFMDGANEVQANLKGAKVGPSCRCHQSSSFLIDGEGGYQANRRSEGQENRYYPGRFIDPHLGALCA